MPMVRKNSSHLQLRGNLRCVCRIMACGNARGRFQAPPTPLSCSSAIRAENLVLRKQLAHYIERGVKPRSVDAVTRIRLALLTRLFDWHDAVVIVRPKTIIRWHRAGWSLFWRLKCKLGRPPIPAELRALIRKMASENPVWGEERIASELLIKLSIRVSPRTVGKYMPK